MKDHCHKNHAFKQDDPRRHPWEAAAGEQDPEDDRSGSFPGLPDPGRRIPFVWSILATAGLWVLIGTAV